MCGPVIEEARDELEQKVDKATSNPFEALLNVSANMATGGLVGFEDGGVSKGIVTEGASNVVGKPVIKGLKDLTGVTAAEEANNIARQNFEDQKNRALKDRKEAQWRSARDQLMASRSAGKNRVSTQNTPNAGGSTYSSSLGGEAQDFLGL